MGFWHTGYLEFHEPEWLLGKWEPAPVRLPCSHCGLVFASEDELRRHRFEVHPLRRPSLFLDNMEIGSRRVKIARPIAPTQVRVEGAERAVLNGREIALSNLGHKLAEISDDVCCIALSKHGIEAQFEIEIRVASEGDMSGVEAQFTRMAQCGRLDVRAIEEFIAGASRFNSAIGYCDGICAYLYGLLAKERAADCTLPYEAYVARYAKAAEELAPYDRKLAQTISGLIEFHFNHFRDAERLCPGSRQGGVARRFAGWIESRAAVPLTCTDITDQKAVELEGLVTEWDTERILGWASRSLAELADCVEDMEQFLCRDLAEFDRVKLHMLLGEALAAAGNPKLALQHAKMLRNLPELEDWAEALIRDLGENK